MRELPIPPLAREDPDSLEMIRVWIANRRQHFALSAEVWDDPSCWGVLLADLARNLSDAYEKRGISPRDAGLLAIRQAFEMELDSPTESAVGDFLDD